MATRSKTSALGHPSRARDSRQREKRVHRRTLSPSSVSVGTMLGRYQLGNDDAVEWLSNIEDGSVNLVVTDPAYESLEKHRAIGTTTRLSNSKASSNPWFDIFPNARFESLFSEFYRVLAKDSHFYLMCDQETMFYAKPIGERVGFTFWKPIIWDKKRIGMGYHYRARYECILFFEKGKRKLNDLGIPDILEVPRVHKGYPTEKPVDLSAILIEQSTEEGDLVIDPFYGSGSTAVAAVQSGRDFAGTDKSAHAQEHATARLRELGAQEAVLSAARRQHMLPL